MDFLISNIINKKKTLYRPLHFPQITKTNDVITLNLITFYDLILLGNVKTKQNENNSVNRRIAYAICK